MAQSSIEWTELTWNPTTGCTKVSQGCKFCYAEVMSKRLKSMGISKYKEGFKIALHREELKKPYSWKKRKVVFVNSMSDLFHPEVPIKFIQDVFKVMNETNHIYQVLTKRPERVLEIQEKLHWTENIWLGTSVEEEKVVDRAIALSTTFAKTKFLSIEPLIGPVYSLNLTNIDWVIVGGESGPKARPLQADWVKKIKDQCLISNTPFFFKQWGKPKFNVNQEDPTIQKTHPLHAKGGCELEGQIFRQMPTFV
tara:strand:+ start:1112 stop:1867 length:756 start_codon:yes stop_codon:yes gene_type:complete